jgi:hypothetical protein
MVKVVEKFEYWRLVTSMVGYYGSNILVVLMEIGLLWALFINMVAVVFLQIFRKNGIRRSMSSLSSLSRL